MHTCLCVKYVVINFTIIFTLFFLMLKLFHIWQMETLLVDFCVLLPISI